MSTIKIGRSKSNDCVFAQDESVSGNHAILNWNSSTRTGTLKDLNSTNGTFVNNKRISAETPVTEKDSIRFGSRMTSVQEILSLTQKAKVKATPSYIPGQQLIGKSSSCQIRFTQDDVSREHAVLYKAPDGSVVIEDRGSTNGTFVNGMRIKSQRLQPGDRVTITRNYPLNWEAYMKTGTSAASTKTKMSAGLIAAIIALAVVLVGGGIWLFLNKDMNPQKIFAKYQKSVAFIYTQYTYQVTIDERPISQIVDGFPDQWYIDESGDPKPGIIGSAGTGFFVSKDGKLVTNRHVVTLNGREQQEAQFLRNAIAEFLLETYGYQAQKAVNALSVTFVSKTGIAVNDTHLQSEDDLIPCTVIGVSNDPKLDIAVLQVNSKQTPSIVENIVDLDDIASEKNMKIGKKVHTLGFPKGIEWALTQKGLQATNESGTVNQEVDNYLYGHNINVTHGASGSPVFDSKGKFAGIIVSGAEYQAIGADGTVQNIPAQHNQAIKPAPAAEFIKKNF